MGNSIPITSKTSAVAPAKKMNKDIVNASKGNKYDQTTATLRAVAGAPPIVNTPSTGSTNDKNTKESEEQSKPSETNTNGGGGGNEEMPKSFGMDTPINTPPPPINTDEEEKKSTLMPETPAMYSPAKDKGHGFGPDKPSTQPDKHTHTEGVYNEKGQQGVLKNIPAVKGVKGVKGKPAVPKTSLVDAYKNADKTKYPDFESFKVAAEADPLYGTSGSDAIPEVKEVKAVPESNEFVLNKETVPGTETVEEGKPDAYVSNAWDMRQNTRALNKFDKNRIKQLKKLRKSRDGKGFLGFKRKSEQKNEYGGSDYTGPKPGEEGFVDNRYAENIAIDDTIQQRLKETRPEGSGTDIFRYGLDNKGVGGKATGGTLDKKETTDPTTGYVNWNKDKDAVPQTFYNTETGKTEEVEGNKMWESMTATAANPVPAAVYHPEKIKIGNSKSFKMKGMKFKG